MNLNKFKNFFKNLQNKNVYIGFSGGSDSRLILEIAKYFQQEYKYTLTAINFEHGIRGKESIEDSNFCVNVCKQLGIPISVIPLKINANEKNIECVARQK